MIGCSVQPGKWLGPWVLCKTLVSLGSKVQPHGMAFHMVCDPSGGGAPALDVQQVRSMLPSETWAAQRASADAGSLRAAAAAPVQPGMGTSAATTKAASIAPYLAEAFLPPIRSQTSGTGKADPLSLAPPPLPSPPLLAAVTSKPGSPRQLNPTSSSTAPIASSRDVCYHQEQQQQPLQPSQCSQSSPPSQGLLLLVPLTLGVDKVIICELRLFESVVIAIRKTAFDPARDMTPVCV